MPARPETCRALPPEGERRRAPRLRSLIEAQAEFPDGLRTFSVMVRNIGPHGAMVEADCLAVLPQRFRLAMPGRGAAREARLRWRSYSAAGVSFEPN